MAHPVTHGPASVTKLGTVVMMVTGWREKGLFCVKQLGSGRQLLLVKVSTQKQQLVNLEYLGNLLQSSICHRHLFLFVINYSV